MDKNAIKKYAIWARNELISRVTQKAEQYEITEKKTTPKDADSINGRLLSDVEKNQRKALIEKIQADGFEQVMEEVAYTWFNRFTALRFMEVNNYLPSHTRVFTNEAGEFKPQILTDAIQLDLEGLDMDKVFELKDANKSEELYKYLLITQCNALSAVLPRMFQKIEDYTELLLPDYLLREGSVIEEMVSEIPESDWNISNGGQIEILGWLYQYYISEKHEEVVNAIGKKTVEKENVPAATALFTTDWVVRYIIDNSIGRYWIERHPNSTLKEQLDFYVDSDTIKIIKEDIRPEELTVLDPSMGSAHFGLYAFEVLLKIYVEYGFTEREAAGAIVENNLFGLDIDDRSAQIAYFAIMMKAMQYDRRFLKRGIQPRFYSIQESNHVDPYAVDYFINGNEKLRKSISSILDDFKDAKEYGSILQVHSVDFKALYDRFEEIQYGQDTSLYSGTVVDQLLPLVRVAEIMTKKYAVVATNPPYLNKFDAKLKNFINENYKDYSGDLFSVFMYRNFGFCRPDGYSGFMTPNVWMFISSYEKLRRFLIEKKSVSVCVQLAKGAFFKEATVDICAFVLKNEPGEIGVYTRLENFKGDMDVQERKLLDAIHGDKSYTFQRSMESFWRIEDEPFAYWISDRFAHVFETAEPLSKVAPPKQGLATADNNRFLRLWFEPVLSHIGFGIDSCETAEKSGLKWFPYNKGGAFRRWYGNRDYVVNWENDGFEIKNFKDQNGKVRSRPQNLKYYFQPSITWSDLTSASFSGRFCEGGFIFDIKGSSGFPPKNNHLYVLGLLNSKISQECISVLNPTVSTQVGDMARIPVFVDEKRKQRIEELVLQCVEDSKQDWDSFETSWDFTKHPLVRKRGLIADAFEEWKRDCETRFNRVKANEEEINRLFIEIYGVEDEITPEVSADSITIHSADLARDIRGLISYAVGCMFGRYSLDEEGLIFAGGEWDTTKYISFPADKDGILPVCDDEYFDDDITGMFIRFISKVYGTDTLEENLQFIAKAIGGKGTSREIIRNYFLNEFFSNHCSVYSVSGSGKRPIYWLFDSGKENGFKCLIYMHRYQQDTIARIRTDYVHEQQSRYRTAISDIEQRMNSASGADRIKLNKQLLTLQAQSEEIRQFEEKIHHLADQMISIDLDDGVKHNYEIFKDVLAKIK